MKKFLIILLSLALSVSMFMFAACSDTPADDDPQTGNEQTGDDGQDGTQPDGDDENAGDDTTEAQPPHTAGDPDSDTLVVYFSWSSSQNTEHMAEYIAEATGGYLVEIVPEEPYVGSYNDVAYGRAQEEAEQNARPAVSQATYDLIDLQKYDTVLVGYPIWWHTAPMVVGTFLEHYDWTNKDIYPFSQSASMDEEQFAQSEQFVRDCAENATVHDGLFVRPSATQAIVANRAFSRSVSVTELYIPSSVTEIGSYIAANATLSSIHYAGTEEEWNAVQKGSLWDLDNEGVQIVYSDTAEEETDILVVYFSATGNTERVAGYIAETTGGDLFELVPVNPYTSDDLRWTDDDSRVVQEYESPEAPPTRMQPTCSTSFAYLLTFSSYVREYLFKIS